MPHNATARHAAAAVPLVLFGEHGRTVEGYAPAPDDLDAAKPAASHRAGDTLAGPHLLVVRGHHARNRTGVVGISVGRYSRTGRHYLYVNLGKNKRAFCIETLGRTEAWRRAVELRREHVRKIEQANASILAARASANAYNT